MCVSDGKKVADVRNMHAHVLRSADDWNDAMNALRERMTSATFDFVFRLKRKYVHQYHG